MSIQSDSEPIEGSWLRSVITAALLLLIFFLPLISWPGNGGEKESWNGYDVVLGSIAGVGARYSAELSLAKDLAIREQATLDRFLTRVEKDEATARQARQKADADVGNSNAVKNAERRERRAEKSRSQYEQKLAQTDLTASPKEGLWSFYLYYLFPLMVVATYLLLAVNLARSLLGKFSSTGMAISGLMVFSSFLAAHAWLGIEMLSNLTPTGWLLVVLGLLLPIFALGMQRTADWIDALNMKIGTSVAWVSLFMVVVQFTLVLMRYIFGLGSIFVQESLVYGHGILFMVAAAYTMLLGGHVRVDIFYRDASTRTKALVDTFGVFGLLIPFMLLIWYYSLPYVANSWMVLEGSRETSGIPGVFLLKTTILVFVVLIILQGLSLAFRSIGVLLGQVESAGSATEGGH